MVGEPSRAQAIEWARAHCPDLRFQHREGASRAKFTVDGKSFQVETTGDDSRETIPLEVWRTIRRAHGMPVPEKRTVTETELVRSIMRARMLGQSENADKLEQQLISARLRAYPNAPKVRVRPRDTEPGSTLRQELFGNRKVF
jgi:hypothetical protein